VAKIPTFEEIRRAHETVEAILCGTVKIPAIDGSILDKLEENRSVLCWILGHENGARFEERIKLMEAIITVRGYKYEEETGARDPGVN
jgi:hypothetical protein